MKTRERCVVVKVNDLELAQLHALAEAGDEPIARWLRRTIEGAYRDRFGSSPPPKPQTKFPAVTPKTKARRSA